MATENIVLAVITEGPHKGSFIEFDEETSIGRIISNLNDVSERLKNDAKVEFNEARYTRHTLDDLLKRVQLLESLREGDRSRLDSERRLLNAERGLMVSQTERAETLIQRLELQLNAIEDKKKPLL